MKLRQHKREHYKRLRRRIAHRRADELLAQFDRGMDNVASALANALLAQGAMVHAAFASIANGFARVAIRPSRSRQSPLRTVTAPAPGTGPLCGMRITQVWIDEMPCVLGTELMDGMRIEAGANGAPVVHADGSKVSAAALIAMADEISPCSVSGTLQVAMTAEHRQRALRVIEKVWRDDPRRFTFHQKLPRR